MSSKTKTGMDRREFLRRAAVTGAAAAWTVPVIKTLAGTPALGQTVDGTPKDISYVAVCYTCSTGQECQVKFDLRDTGGVEDCESSGGMSTPQCGFDCRHDSGCPDGCSIFDVATSDGSKTVVVSFKSGADPNCSIIEGRGVGKCGNPEQPQSGGECVPGTVSNGGRTITFSMCGN